MSDESAQPDPRLGEWIRVVDYYWQRAGLAEPHRARLRDDLMDDLLASWSHGAPVEDLVAVDPAQFAAALAQADGAPPRPLRSDPPLTGGGLVATMLGGAAAGFALAVVSVYPVGFRLMDAFSADFEQQGWITLGLHALADCLALAGALGAVWWRYRFRGQVRRTLVVSGILFALAGTASIAPTMALAGALGYPDDSWIVMTEVAMVVGSLSLGAWLAFRYLTAHAPPTTP